MSKQKTKVISKHPIKRRTTFKKHPKKYVKVYAPYLPAIIGLVISMSLLLPREPDSSGTVLSYADSVSSASLFEETNERRLDNDKDGLALNDALSLAAQAKAEDMAAKDYWSHVSADGKQPWYFIEQSGYRYGAAAENLAYGFTSSEETVNGWMNSTEHKKAMLSDEMIDVGFGIANAPNYRGHGPETIIVALYAKPQQTGGDVNANFTSNPASSISLGQILTAGKYPWINLVAGLIIGAIGTYLLTKHSLKLRKRIRQGEQYVLHHPIVDISLISLLILLIALSQTAGFIQ